MLEHSLAVWAVVLCKDSIRLAVCWLRGVVGRWLAQRVMFPSKLLSCSWLFLQVHSPHNTSIKQCVCCSTRMHGIWTGSTRFNERTSSFLFGESCFVLALRTRSTKNQTGMQEQRSAFIFIMADEVQARVVDNGSGMCKACLLAMTRLVRLDGEERRISKQSKKQSKK